jgi:hypothetical protein
LLIHSSPEELFSTSAYFGYCFYEHQSVCKYLFDSLLSIILDIYLGIELLNHTVILWLTFWGATELFSVTAAPFYLPISNFLHPHQHFLKIAMLIGVKWYLIETFICIYLYTNDIENDFIYLLAILYLLLGKYLYINPLSIFHLSGACACLFFA